MLPHFIKSAIETELKVAIDFEFEEAKKRIEARKSEIIAGVILYITKTITMESLENKLIITVRTEQSN